MSRNHKSFLESVQRTQITFIPAIRQLGYDAEFRIGSGIYEPKPMKLWREWSRTESRFVHTEYTKGTGLNLEVFSQSNVTQRRTIIPWTRPESWSRGQLMQALKTYPRYHMTKEQKTLAEDARIENCLKFLNCNNVYFCVILPRRDRDPLFWFDKYSSIQKQDWGLTTRNSKKDYSEPVKDRMYAKTKGLKTSLLDMNGLKKMLDILFSTPNEPFSNPLPDRAAIQNPTIL